MGLRRRLPSPPDLLIGPRVRSSGTRDHSLGKIQLNEADSGQTMADETAIDVYKRGTYSEDHREHRDGDGYAPNGAPIEHDATLTDR